MDAQTWHQISVIGYSLAGLLSFIGIILFFKLDIWAVINDLTGRRAAKEIQEIREKNTRPGNKIYQPSPFNLERGRLTEPVTSRRLGRKSSGSLTKGFRRRIRGPLDPEITDRIPAELSLEGGQAVQKSPGIQNRDREETTVLKGNEILTGEETTVLKGSEVFLTGEETTVLSGRGVLTDNETTVLNGDQVLAGDETTALSSNEVLMGNETTVLMNNQSSKVDGTAVLNRDQSQFIEGTTVLNNKTNRFRDRTETIHQSTLVSAHEAANILPANANVQVNEATTVLSGNANIQVNETSTQVLNAGKVDYRLEGMKTTVLNPTEELEGEEQVAQAVDFKILKDIKITHTNKVL